MKLIELLNILPEYTSLNKANPEIKGITEDSRKVKKGYLFVAIKGLTVDGHKFIAQAIDRGAVVIVGQEDKSKLDIKNVAQYVKVGNSRAALGYIASQFNGNPSNKLKVVGVTGTDGKTTTASLIYHILNNCGIKTGLISTISARIGSNEIDTGFHVTNPDPVSLQKLLNEMVKKNCKFAVIEVTSHGLDQDRVAGINFDSAVLTNITHEHLDYHKTWEAYRDSKLKLFLMAHKFIVLNKDDPSYKYISKSVNPNLGIFAYSLYPDRALTYAQNIIHKKTGTEFDLVDRVTPMAFDTLLRGNYNISNILAAVTCTRHLGLDLEAVRKAVSVFKPPVGRLQKLKNKHGFDIYVDFAHTPNALENVLKTLRKQLTDDQRLIVVFGCAGERDVEKREMMGEISTRLADISVFTAEDPRNENVNKIIAQMVRGAEKTASVELERFIGINKLNKKHAFLRIPERGEAISVAIQEIASKRDTIVVCGKGHEKSMAYNGIEYPWSDQEAVMIALKGSVKKIIR